MPDILPVILGISGTDLTEPEISLFRRARPAGYILFARNCQTPEQLKALTASMKALHGDYEPLILIDQEGGRVARLRSPQWWSPPAAQQFADQTDRDGLGPACEAARQTNRAIASTLREMGITVNCTPMCDIRYTHSHDIIGDRAYGQTPEQVTALAEVVADAHLQEGVLPVIKHIPGHGRAVVDSHEALPVVDASLSELEQDFAPFQALHHLPLAMTAHICYAALDPALPATLSPKVIRFIRNHIGFTHVLLSDDLCMKALNGSPEELALASLKAGCDLVLHCNGNLAEMTQIVDRLAAEGKQCPHARLAWLHDVARAHP